MPATATTTTTHSADGAAVAAALSAYPDGATARALASDTGLSEPAVRRALSTLVDSGGATRAPGTGRGKHRTPDTWATSPTDTTIDSAPATDSATGNTADTAATTDDETSQPDPTDPPTDPDATTGPAAPDAANATTAVNGHGRADSDQRDTGTTGLDATGTATATSDTATPTSDTATNNPDTPVSATDTTEDGDGVPVPVSPAPVGSADHMKVVMVAAILGDHPDGVTAADIVTESGLRGAIVGRVLTAMELAGAAVRTTDPASGTESWTRGEAALDTVDLSAVVSWKVCPECGHRTRVRAGVPVTRTASTEPGRNADGQPTLGKNALRTMVAEFLTAHPGHQFTAGTIARELNRSSGAVGNALAKLVTASEAVLVNEAPMTYSAPPATEPTTGETGASGTTTTAA